MHALHYEHLVYVVLFPRLPVICTLSYIQPECCCMLALLTNIGIICLTHAVKSYNMWYITLAHCEMFDLLT